MKPSIGNYAEQRARMELLGSAGAGVLGAGLALAFREVLAPLAIPLLVVGGLTHASAMYTKHRLDSAGDAILPRWVSWAYWACWLLLAVLLVYFLAVVA